MAKKTIYAVPVCSLIFSLAFREVLCDSERDYYNKFFDSKKRKPANYIAIMTTMDDVHFTIQGVVRNNAAFDVIGDMVAKQSGRYSTAHVFGNECIHLGNAIRSNRKKENRGRSCDLFLSYDENPMCIPGVTFTEKRAKKHKPPRFIRRLFAYSQTYVIIYMKDRNVLFEDPDSTLGGICMKKYAIFTDATSDLTLAEREKYGIWPVQFEQETSYKGEIVDTSDPDAFYDKLSSGVYTPGNLKTAAASPGQAEALIEDIVNNTSDDTIIVYAGVSPNMSAGTIGAVNIALEACAEKYPDREFIYVDSRSISNGLATFLQYLARYDGDDILSYGDELGKHMIHLFTLRDLSFSAKSGRFNLLERFAMGAMTTMKLSPWMHFPSADKLCMDGTPRRADKILREWVDYYVANVADDNDFVRIGYGGREELKRAEKLIRLLKDKTDLTDEQIQLVRVGPIIGTHTGSTVLSFFFKQKGVR